jgi:alcohol dehydrogenase class IV
MSGYMFQSPRTLIVEAGAAARIGEIAARLHAGSVLLVSDRGVERAGLLDVPLQDLRACGMAVEVFLDVEADPSAATVQAAAAKALACHADCVIAIGGGSPMDVAKLAALLARSGEALDEIYGVGLARGPRLPLILVPTTAGTGSEVTPISIVTTGEGAKKGVVSDILLPDIAVLDAHLTLGLPGHVSAATGIDAMVHAIEAYTSRRLKNPISDALAREALRLLGANLVRVCENGADVKAREAMLLGANLAGMAFANAPVAAVHALAYPVGARFHVPHGLSNSLVLPAVMRFNLSHAAPLYAELAPLVLPDIGMGGTQIARAEALIDWLCALAPNLGLPVRLEEVGITRQDLPALAEDAMQQTRLLINNPRELSYEDAFRIYEEVA